MSKKKMLSDLNDARESHQLQMHTVALMIRGKKVSHTLEVDKHKCGFGQWLYNEDNHLKHILGSQFYAKLDDEHTRWNSEFHKISEILDVQEKKGFISKLIGCSKEEHMKRKKASVYHEQLKVQTNELLKVLISSERRLEAMHDDKFIV